MAPIRPLVLAFCAIFVLGPALSGCRQDMHNQPKFIPLRSSEFFPDRRSARYPVPGTVPQLCPNFVQAGAKADPSQSDLCVDKEADTAQLDPNSYFLTGWHNRTTLGNELPDEVMQAAQDEVIQAGEANTAANKLRAILNRGQQRYNIYCTPCHAWRGDGYGMVVQRGYKHPPSFHEDRLRNAPLGHFFAVISNGFGAMPDYAAQIHPQDRWAIAAYIRALQRSQNAEPGDLSQQQQAEVSTQKTAPEEHRFPSTSKTDQQRPEAPAGEPKR